MEENYDSFYYDWTQVPGSITTSSNTYPYTYSTTYERRYGYGSYGDASWPAKNPLSHYLTEISEPAKKKEKKLSKQEQLDKEVAEALEIPRREAEVKRRVELAEKIGATDTHEAGTVLRWTRKFGDNEYTYAALKAGNDRWYLTGQNQLMAAGYSWDSLVQWMVTGENTIENLEVAGSWSAVVS